MGSDERLQDIKEQLPAWELCRVRVENGTAGPLERFIFENEPTYPGGVDMFHHYLAMLLAKPSALTEATQPSHDEQFALKVWSQVRAAGWDVHVNLVAAVLDIAERKRRPRFAKPEMLTSEHVPFPTPWRIEEHVLIGNTSGCHSVIEIKTADHRDVVGFLNPNHDQEQLFRRIVDTVNASQTAELVRVTRLMNQWRESYEQMANRLCGSEADVQRLQEENAALLKEVQNSTARKVVSSVFESPACPDHEWKPGE